MSEGIIIGIGICTFILLADIWLYTESETKKRLVSYIKKRPTAQILAPQSESEREVSDIIAENEKKGRDTPIEDIIR